MSRFSLFTLSFALLGFHGLAQADSPEMFYGGIKYGCFNTADEFRRIEVDYLSPPSSLPCEVNYYDDATPDTVKKLWAATSTRGFCEKKAAKEVKKLQAAGWTCSEG